MLIEIWRCSDTPEAKLGVLVVDGIAEMVTLELPYKGNQKNISCIPIGVYQMKKRPSQKTYLKSSFEVLNVPGRSNIIFHEGNSTNDTRGCILVGTSYGVSDTGKPTITNSRRAMLKLMNLLTEEVYDLVVRDVRA